MVVFYIIAALVFNLIIGSIAIKKQALSVPDGVIAAAITGITIFLAHYILWIALMSFFFSSTILTKFKEKDEKKVAAFNFAEKGGKRDVLQVFANGGVAFLFSIIILFVSGMRTYTPADPLFLIVVISIASSTADTWATEIGTTSSKEPVWIFNFKKHVPRGSSGGISIIGTLGSLLGSLFISIIYLFSIYLISPDNFSTDEVFIFGILIVIGGFLGSLIDTILGATMQSVSRCDFCDKITEKKFHFHDKKINTIPFKGVSWLDNDVVNILSGLFSSLLIVGTYLYLIR